MPEMSTIDKVGLLQQGLMVQKPYCDPYINILSEIYK